MKRFSIFAMILSFGLLGAQPLQYLTIQPGPEDGYDAPIRALSLDSADNRGAYQWLRSSAWTQLGEPYVWKTLIDFPAIDSIKNADVIVSAKLVLYADRDFPADLGGQYADNTSTLSLITSPWEEETVVWHSRPSYDASVSVTIPQNNNYDSIEVDITSVLLHCKRNNLPFYGLVLQPEDHSFYRSMVFFSSDAEDPLKRPKLKLIYRYEACLNCASEYWTLVDAKGDSDIYRSGKVAIGTQDPGPFQLTVNGEIRSKEITVDPTSWPDYVFSKDHKIPSLDSVRQFIDLNGHLPGVPDASQVLAGGVSIGKFQTVLLEKVEEVFIHLIRMEKENEALRSDNDALRKQISEMQNDR